MKIISISGLDGCGKSTQIEMLKNFLETRGKRVYCFHAVEFSLINNIMIFLKKMLGVFSSSQEGEARARGITRSGFWGIWIRKIALKIDMFRFNNLLKNLEKNNYDYVISDRYFYDTIVNIEYLLNQPSFTEKLSFQIPKPNLAIYLKADPEAIMRREKVPDQGIEYLKNKKELYEKAANVLKLKVISGNSSPEAIYEKIKGIVCQKFF